MKLPKQAAPIQRTIPTASISNENGIEASAWYDDLWSGVKNVASNVAPIALKLLG